MKFAALLVLVCIAATHGFRFGPIMAQRIVARSHSVLKMSDENTVTTATPSKPKVSKPATTTELVPLNQETIGSAATATGGILGFVLGGPVLAAILAAVTSYVAKQDGDSGDAIRGVGKTVVEAYNYVTNINGKYGISNKVADSVTKTVSKLEQESEVVEKVITTVESTTSKLDELNKEYDLVAKGKQVLVAAGTLSDAALAKLAELNQKYDFVEQTKKAAATAAEKAKEAANKARSA